MNKIKKIDKLISICVQNNSAEQAYNFLAYQPNLTASQKDSLISILYLNEVSKYVTDLFYNDVKLNKEQTGRVISILEKQKDALSAHSLLRDYNSKLTKEHKSKLIAIIASARNLEAISFVLLHSNITLTSAQVDKLIGSLESLEWLLRHLSQIYCDRECKDLTKKQKQRLRVLSGR